MRIGWVLIRILRKIIIMMIKKSINDLNDNNENDHKSIDNSDDDDDESV